MKSVRTTKRTRPERGGRSSEGVQPRMTRMTLDEARDLVERGMGGTDWVRVDALTDADIERAVAEDPDAAPLFDEAFLRAASVLVPAAATDKVMVSLRVDSEVVEFFRTQGPGYQSRMNAVLRAYYLAAAAGKRGHTRKRRKAGTRR